MKQLFREINFRADSRNKIEQMDSIIQEYQRQGLRLTARQLYYQFVSRDLIPNLPAEYKKLTALLTDARYAGLLDWDAIEDRGREPNSPLEFRDLSHRIEAAMQNYRLPRWKGQEDYVELWVEKQALAGVLEPLARKFHVTLMVNKGYSSASAMKESADRILEATLGEDKKSQMDDLRCSYLPGPYLEDQLAIVSCSGRSARIFYLGDHDPSGEDMVRDIGTRLKEFGAENLSVQKLALTTGQIKKYKPPPNPAKLTDPRAAAYIEQHGNKSWEVDALPPNVLTALIENAFEEIVDLDKMNAVIEQEDSDKKRLLAAVKKIK